MTVFSKYAYPEDQEVADMVFHYENPDDFYEMYYIDGKLGVERDGDYLIVNYDANQSHFNWAIQIMRERYEWYYGREYTDVMKHIKIHKSNKEAGLRAIYNDMDYPLLRDSTCPYHCEGCSNMKICSFCSAPVSICQATKNRDEDEVTYYCDEECCNAYFRAEYDRRIANRLKKDYESSQKEEIRLVESALRGSRQTIHLKGFDLRGKRVYKRNELEVYLKMMNLELRKTVVENLLLVSFLKRNKPAYDKYYGEIQEIVGDLMASAPDSQVLLEVAQSGKEMMALIQDYASVYFS